MVAESVVAYVENALYDWVSIRLLGMSWTTRKMVAETVVAYVCIAQAGIHICIYVLRSGRRTERPQKR